MSQYFTIGNDVRPLYDLEDDPQHCFGTIEEAREELEYMQEEFPLAGFTYVWFIQGLFHASRQE